MISFILLNVLFAVPSIELEQREEILPEKKFAFKQIGLQTN
jgi:hypothetical protein